MKFQNTYLLKSQTIFNIYSDNHEILTDLNLSNYGFLTGVLQLGLNELFLVYIDMIEKKVFFIDLLNRKEYKDIFFKNWMYNLRINFFNYKNSF